jgi:hypothetical protein
MKTNRSGLISFVLMLILMTFSMTAYAVPYLIVPKTGTTLPTQITPGVTAIALYTVTNITSRALPASFVKYLPLNVQQITVDPSYPDLCGLTFNLAAGSSCTLELSVSGPVIPCNPNPHLNLFVCSPNVPACAGTSSPLNVSVGAGPTLVSISVTPIGELIATGATLQFRAIGTFSDGSTRDVTTSVNWSSSNTAVATIGDRTGLATGVTAGPITITASSDSIAGTTPLTIKAQFAYIANNGGSVSTCPVNPDGSFGTCNIFTDASFHNPKGITLNSAYTFAYVANQSSGSVSICPVNANGQLTTCTSAVDATFNGAQGITLNAAETILYVSNEFGTTVSICPVLTNGSTLGPCSAVTGNATFNHATSVILNSTGTFAYVTNFGNTTISICPLNPDGTFGTCTTTTAGGTLSKPVGTILNSSNTFAYTTNNNNATPPYTISICAVNSDGSFGACSSVSASGTLNLPEGIGINAANSNVYITNQGNNLVSICPVTGGGASFGTCTSNGGGGAFNLPFSAYIH